MATSIVARLLIYEGDSRAVEEQLGSSLGDGVKIIRTCSGPDALHGPLTIRAVTLTPGMLAALCALGATLSLPVVPVLADWKKPTGSAATEDFGTGIAPLIREEEPRS